ncbi:single-stranded DNA-binding protein [Kocuria coralli]|nr:single-stranded DNA-binding protein [Kocuria coralli]
MTDTITVRGFVATKPLLRQTAANTHVTDFRLASTSRRFDAERGEWVDAGGTNWYTVNCFRYMADNVAASLNVGDPVLVQGRLKIREWTSDAGHKRQNVEIEASALGPDLAMGSASYTRVGAHRSAGNDRDPAGEPDQRTPPYDPDTGEVLDDAAEAMTGSQQPSPLTGGDGHPGGEPADLDEESELEVSAPDLDSVLNPGRDTAGV